MDGLEWKTLSKWMIWAYPLFLGNTHLEMSQKTSADNRENFVILPNFPTVNLRCKDLTFIRRICILKFHPYQGHLTKTAWVVPLDPEISSCKKPFIHASEQFILPEANSESSPLEINDWKMKFPFWGIAFKKWEKERLFHSFCAFSNSWQIFYNPTEGKPTARLSCPFPSCFPPGRNRKRGHQTKFCGTTGFNGLTIQAYRLSVMPFGWAHWVKGRPPCWWYICC